MAEMVPAVCAVLDAIEARDWDALGALLHPAIHWSNAIEEQFHGPPAVIAQLQTDPPPAPPSFHELDGGLMVRWIDCPG